MDKYKSGGEQAVRKVLGAPAVKKSQVWQEAARRFEQYLSEQNKEETPAQTAKTTQETETKETPTKENPIEETKTTTPETVPETPAPKTSQEVQKKEVGEPVKEVERERYGIPKKQFEEGLKNIGKHKFRDGNGISYDEMLEIEKELFGKVGVLGQYQFQDLEASALNEKYGEDEEESTQTSQEVQQQPAKEEVK